VQLLWFAVPVRATAQPFSRRSGRVCNGAIPYLSCTMVVVERALGLFILCAISSSIQRANGYMWRLQWRRFALLWILWAAHAALVPIVFWVKGRANLEACQTHDSSGAAVDAAGEPRAACLSVDLKQQSRAEVSAEMGTAWPQGRSRNSVVPAHEAGSSAPTVGLQKRTSRSQAG
jgi:hypothetical protein